MATRFTPEKTEGAGFHAGSEAWARRLPRQHQRAVNRLVPSKCRRGLASRTALVRQMLGRWDRSRTVVVALECLGGGQLRVLEDGEILRQPVPAWLMAAVQRAADARDQPISSYELPAGCTDVLPFLVRGYDGLCFVRIDPRTGVPTNYHLPSDRPENLNYQQLAQTIGFVERFVREVVRLKQTSADER